MPFGVMQHLNVVLCADAEEATARGFGRDDLYKVATSVEIDTAVVVRSGTRGGNSTVDLVLKDQQGNTYVVMVTGALLRTLPL